MEQEKGHSTEIQVTGCEAQASTSEAIAQQSFDSWVWAMESAWLEQQRELARIAIGEARAARRAQMQTDYDRERTQRILDGLGAMRSVARANIKELRAARARAKGRK